MGKRPRQERKKVDLEMVWTLDALGFAGRGMILDMSVNGARIQLNRTLVIPAGSLLEIASQHFKGGMPTARIRWSRHVAGTTHCGVQFVSAGPIWQAWVAAQSEAAKPAEAVPESSVA